MEIDSQVMCGKCRRVVSDYSNEWEIMPLNKLAKRIPSSHGLGDDFYDQAGSVDD